jgi:hypothetical protein
MKQRVWGVSCNIWSLVGDNSYFDMLRLSWSELFMTVS